LKREGAAWYIPISNCKYEKLNNHTMKLTSQFFENAKTTGKNYFSYKVKNVTFCSKQNPVFILCTKNTAFMYEFKVKCWNQSNEFKFFVTKTFAPNYFLCRLKAGS